MKHILIVTGGSIEREFALSVCKTEDFYKIIGVDGGAGFLYENDIMPTDLVGDFDTLAPEILTFYRKETDAAIRRFQPEKDATDTEIALRLAVELGAERITVLGAFGTRLDHLLGNLFILNIALDAGIPCRLLDSRNCAYLADRSFTRKREEAFGSYISLFPMGGEVTGLTLRGVKYPLTDYRLSGTDSLCLSNEITDAEAGIAFSSGCLLVIESSDVPLLMEPKMTVLQMGAHF